MNRILVNALLARIQAGQVTLEQVPIPLQEEVEQRLYDVVG